MVVVYLFPLWLAVDERNKRAESSGSEEAKNG
jgi:hypothetical protein